MYIYIEREREKNITRSRHCNTCRARARRATRRVPNGLDTCVREGRLGYVCICISLSLSIYIYIYIYAYI